MSSALAWVLGAAVVASTFAALAVSIREFETRLLLRPQRIKNYQHFPANQFLHVHLKRGGVLVCGIPSGSEPTSEKRFSRPIALICHGNAGTIDSISEISSIVRDRGYEPWLLEYRGFGVSTMKLLSMEDLVDDLDDAISCLKTSFHSKVAVLIGFSMGGGVACQWIGRRVTAIQQDPKSMRETPSKEEETHHQHESTPDKTDLCLPDQLILLNSFASLPRVVNDATNGVLSLLLLTMKTQWDSGKELFRWSQQILTDRKKETKETGTQNEMKRIVLVSTQDDKLIHWSHMNQLSKLLSKKVAVGEVLPNGGHCSSLVTHQKQWVRHLQCTK